MITQFNCTCGNTNPKKAIEYDGALGYEATVCKICGRYYDIYGEHPADTWSSVYIEKGSNVKAWMDINTINVLFGDLNEDNKIAVITNMIASLPTDKAKLFIK